MKRLAIVLLVIFCSLTLSVENDDSELEKTKLQGEKKIADQLMLILEHYKQPDPIGIPGLQIPDPMPIPNMKKSFSLVTMNFENMNVYGLSKFRILHIISEMASMEVNAALKIDLLRVLGNYTMYTWINRSKGPFTVDLSDVNVQGTVNLGIERDGKLRAQDIKMDITFSKIDMNFENLGFMGSMFQSILNSVGTFLFDSIKPFVLKEAYTKIREEINKNLEKVASDVQFPNSISPLDMVIAETRNKVRQMNLDPYIVKDYNYTKDFYKAKTSNTWLMGLSSFYRVGNITVSIQNNSLIFDFEIGTQKIEGQTQWEIAFVAGLWSRAGTASFTIEYINARVILGQPLDTRKRPQFKDLNLEVGNIQVRCDGAGTMDYAIEAIVNILPNLLRYQIVDAIEGPIRDKVQEKFDKINVEQIIKSKISDIDNVNIDDFKLSSFKDAELPPLETISNPDYWINEIIDE